MLILIERHSYVAWQWSQFMDCLTFLRLDIQVSSQLCCKHFANSLMDAQAPCHIYWIIFHEGGVWQGRAEAQASVQFSSVQLLSHVRLFVTPWTAACQASLSITNSRGSPKLMSVESVMPSNVLFSSCPQSFPASGSFQMSQLFASGCHSTGVSASTSVLPVNTQDWSLLGWTVGSPCSPSISIL